MTARVLLAGSPGADALEVANRLRQDYYSVEIACGEAAALERLQAWRPDIVVLDGAAHEDALDLFRRIRVASACRDLPVFLLSRSDDPEQQLRGLDLGAEDVAGSSLNLDLLLARLRAVLARRWLTLEDLSGFDPTQEALVAHPVTGARALVVADDPAVVAGVQHALARDGVVAASAGSAAQAATLSGAVEFDLLVLDLGLLADEPLGVVAALRAAAATRRVPLLLLGGAASSRLLRAFTLGADDWVTWAGAQAGTVAELRARARLRLRQKLRQDRLRADLAHAFDMAQTDPLTGCYSRRHLLRMMQNLLAAPPAGGVGLLLLQVDRFKDVTERLGFAASDAALVELSALLRRSVSGRDSVARLAGHEFVVLMHGCPRDRVREAAERLRRQVATHVVMTAIGEPVSLSINVGIAVYAGEGAPPTPEGLLHAARQDLDLARAPASKAAPREVAAASGPMMAGP